MRQDVEKQMNQLKNDFWGKTKNKISIKNEVRTGTFIVELKAVCEFIKTYTVIMRSQGKKSFRAVLFW